MQNMFTFNHSGNLTRLFHSLYFCKDLASLTEEKKFNLNIQNNVIENHKNVKIHINIFNKIKPLLNKQEYINDVTLSEKLPENAFDLTSIDKVNFNNKKGYLAEYYYNLTPFHLPREVWKPVINVKPISKYQNKIIVYINPKYYNLYIDFNKLKKYKKHLIFVNFDNNYNLFKDNFFSIERIKYDNFLELAQYIAGAKGFIGTQGEIFTLAECMKVPRILLASEMQTILHEEYFTQKLTNETNINHPYGGWNEYVATTERMQYAIQNLLQK